MLIVRAKFDYQEFRQYQSVASSRYLSVDSSRYLAIKRQVSKVVNFTQGILEQLQVVKAESAALAARIKRESQRSVYKSDKSVEIQEEGIIDK